jgi:hypothetical protein
MGLFSSKPTPSLYGPTPGPSLLGTTTPTPSLASSVNSAGSGFNSMSWWAKILVVLIGVGLIIFSAILIYNAVAAANGKPGVSVIGAPAVPDQAPLPLDGKTLTTIPAANMPLTQGADNGVQFWMYIKDWDYKFGKKKSILLRKDSTNAAFRNPEISLHETDNSLNVTVSIFPGSSGAGSSSSPAPSNSGSASGDSYTCTVENVPLQTWFAVSVTVFQRNLDVYINGKLVKSCVLPGVPRPAAGDILVGDEKGFSGSVCNVHSYPKMLGPTDAAAFFALGTNCSSFAQPSSDSSADKGFSIFGYTFIIKDKSGKVVQSSSL